MAGIADDDVLLLVDELRKRVSALEAQLANTTHARANATSPTEQAELSRRGLLRKFGAVAAVGAGAAVAGGMLNAQPAAANNGDPILAGSTTTATVETTLSGGGFSSLAAETDTWALYASGAGSISDFPLQQCAVVCESHATPALLALSDSNLGVLARTATGQHAVRAEYGLPGFVLPATTTAALGGAATNADGISGASDTRNGVVGTTASGTAAVFGVITSTSSNSAAVRATTAGRGSALYAATTNTASTVAAANIKQFGGGAAISASCTSGLGATLAGGQAPLRLAPRSGTGHPVTGAHTVGELVVDSAGAMFICTVAGTPGTWKRFTVS